MAKGGLCHVTVSFRTIERRHRYYMNAHVRSSQFYDASGRPEQVVYDGAAYWYVTNLQGDVVALVDDSGDVKVSYTYDAWGRPTGKTGSLAGTLGTVQPFRYRGYVFDEETGLYYLRSRYYRSEWCRFANADAVIEYNLYMYCANSPIYLLDRDGFVWTMGAYEPYYGFYHREVQKWIIAHNPKIIMEVITSTGRIDLYSVVTTDIFEVKLDKPEHIKAGREQINRYLRGTLPTKLGNAADLILPPDGTLHYEYENVVVDVHVRAMGALVLYIPFQTRKKKQQIDPAPVVVPNSEAVSNKESSTTSVWAIALGVVY